MSFLEDVFENTTAIDLNSDTFKVVLYNNSITPDQTVTSANFAYNAGQWADTNEVDDSTEWDAGGEPLTSVTSSFSSNVYTFDAADTPSGGSSATLANVYGGLVIDDTITTPVADPGISYHYFGGANSVVDGTFTVVWHSSGIFAATA